MAMTLRLTEEEHAALKACADQTGVSMQEAARQAVREFVERVEHRDRVGAAVDLISENHAEALRRLGE